MLAKLYQICIFVYLRISVFVDIVYEIYRNENC